MKAPQQSLKNWGDQKWRTKSGKKSSETGERYLPEAAIKSLSPAEYAATTRAKRAGKAKGKQFVKQPPKVAKKTELSPVYKKLEDKLASHLSAKVVLQQQKNGSGTITISYQDINGLNTILDAMQVSIS